MGIKATLYKLPNGETEQVEVTNIYLDDSDFFNLHGLRVPMGTLLNDKIVLYCEVGEDEYGEPDEEIFIVPDGLSCFDAFQELRKLVEAHL